MKTAIEYEVYQIEHIPNFRTGQVEKAEQLFKELMQKQLGGNIKIHFKRVSSIEREPSGKLRYFISEINK